MISLYLTYYIQVELLQTKKKKSVNPWKQVSVRELVI